MTEKERIELAIKKGVKYEPKTGNIIGIKGNPITNKNTGGYIYFPVHVKGKKYNVRGHRFAWFYIHKEIPNIIDHINKIRHDNRIVNLRNVNSQQNQFNSKRKGYSKAKNPNKWRARINLNKKEISLGTFNNEDDAKEAYLKAKKKYHII